MRLRVWAWLPAIVVAVIVLGPLASQMITDFLWFQSLDIGSVFMTMLQYRVGVFLGVFILVFSLLYTNYSWAKRKVDKNRSLYGITGIGAISFFIAYGSSHRWETVLRFVHQTSFGITEPLTNTSVSFFVYTYPLLSFLLTIVSLGLVGAWIAALWVYLAASNDGKQMDAADMMLTMEGQLPESSPSMFDIISSLRKKAMGHIRALSGFSLLIIAGWLFLSRYSLFLSESGAVVGVNYTQATITMPLLTGGAIASIITAVVVVAGSRLHLRRITIGMIGLLIIGAIGGVITTATVQSLVVEPDEFNKERQYLEHQIEMTRKGMALDRIQEQQFRPSPNLSIEDIEDNPGTMKNIRLWDYRPLLTTYNELQIFRTYYQFSDVDIDRYNISGMEKQVMLSAREIDLDSLPSQSQTWVNRHLVYTHGFGVAMSPVDVVSEQGLPELYIKDIPPESSVGINVTQPRIYYGEETDTYAITKTKTDELDYPQGESNVYGQYQGTGGIVLDSLLKRLLFAWRFRDPQILVSGSITDESRMQFRRTIQDRVQRIAPFLKFDDDPYIVVTDKGLKWVYDAYTTSNSFPYAEKRWFKGEETNYVRNSVKVVVDAYDGDTTLYIADEEDPLVKTYSDAFPSLFKPLTSMPDDLRDHLRYPEDFFSVQTDAYFNYHMTDPRVFYNREDQWRTPEETLRGSKSEIEPYYVMMQLPDEDKAEFMMIQPFIPQQRENLIGWVGARSDRPNYGEMRAYLFSKQELVFGPAQVDARIDQDTKISQRFTLWSQRGSSVFRGNMLVIPIEDSIIYVEPVFLVSEGSGALPQLRRTIIAHNDRLTMQPSLDQAVKTLFGEVEGSEQLPAVVQPEALEEARTLYREAQQALQDGEFTTYSERIEELGQVLETSSNSTITDN